MKLPNAEQAIVDPEKLADYLLSPEHSRGKHKARVLAASVGITAEHADWLRQELLTAARDGDASPGVADAYGQRFVVEWSITGPTGHVVLVTAWIVRNGENFPRFTTAYVR